MNALVIGDKEYQLPENLSIKQWMEIQKQPFNTDWQISVAMGVPMDEVAIIPDKTKELLNSLITVILHPAFVKLNKTNLINVNDLKLGQFIDLEVYIGEGYNKHLDSIIKVLYQTDNVNNLTINEVWGGIEYYMKWRILLYKQYKNLFNADIEDIDVDEIQQDKAVKTAHIWMDIVMVLADGKFLNMDAVLEKPVIQALNWLAWNKDNKRKEAEALKQLR